MYTYINILKLVVIISLLFTYKLNAATFVANQTEFERAYYLVKHCSIIWARIVLDKISIFGNQFIPKFNYIILIIIFILIAAFFILWERRLLGAIQRRCGPNRTGKGYLQPIADALKSIIKENIIPKYASDWIFWFAPCLSLGISFIICLVVPYYINGSIIQSGYTLLYYYVISSLSVFGVIIAGWASKSKYPLLGAIRACASIISYEVVIGLVIILVGLITQSVSFTQILLFQKQNGWLVWYIPIICPIFFVVSLAELNRTPFDLTESEAELVAGYNVEYSGLLFAFFILAEYINILNTGFVIVIVFFGGGYLFSDNYFLTLYSWLDGKLDKVYYKAEYGLWLVPQEIKWIIENVDHWLIYYSIKRYYKFLLIKKVCLIVKSFFILTITNTCYNYYLYIIVLIIKVLIYCFIVVLVRAALPRYRYDQLINLCWNKLLPICLIYLLILAVYIIIFIL